MRIYLSGPMTGKENYNLEGFANAEYEIKEKAKDVIILNPWIFSGVVNAHCAKLKKSPEYYDYLRYDIQKLVTADAVLMLDGWEDSKGAMIENELAQKVGIPTFTDMRELLEFVKG